jgi:hypothetical protein
VPYGWAQVATFVITGLLIVILAIAVRDQLPHRRASGFAVVLLALLGWRILAAFRVDVPMLTGGNPVTWHGWVHGITFLLIIAMGARCPWPSCCSTCRASVRWPASHGRPTTPPPAKSARTHQRAGTSR